MSASATLLLIGGDGVGAEVIDAAARVARWLVARRRLPLTIARAPFGVSELERSGHLMSAATLARIRRADAVLFGAIGDPAYDAISLQQVRDEGLLRIRRELGLYANLRPIRHYPALADISPFKAQRVNSVELLIVRELAGGLYYGEPRGISVAADGRRVGVNTQRYDSHEISRIAHFALALARRRRGRVCSVDKANVLESGQLWRETVQACQRAHYPDVALEHLLVDHAALQLLLQPASFDVLLADNLFGDILSDAAGALAGSLAMLPSASFGHAHPTDATSRSGVLLRGFYEPVHGSAPDIAGLGIANPLGAILSLALALRWSFGWHAEADWLEQAVTQALAHGARTRDLMPAAPTREPTQARTQTQKNTPALSTRAMTDAVLAALAELGGYG